MYKMQGHDKDHLLLLESINGIKTDLLTGHDMYTYLYDGWQYIENIGDIDKTRERSAMIEIVKYYDKLGIAGPNRDKMEKYLIGGGKVITVKIIDFETGERHILPLIIGKKIYVFENYLIEHHVRALLTRYFLILRDKSTVSDRLQLPPLLICSVYDDIKPINSNILSEKYTGSCIYIMHSILRLLGYDAKKEHHVSDFEITRLISRINGDKNFVEDIEMVMAGIHIGY